MWGCSRSADAVDLEQQSSWRAVHNTVERITAWKHRHCVPADGAAPGPLLSTPAIMCSMLTSSTACLVPASPICCSTCACQQNPQIMKLLCAPAWLPLKRGLMRRSLHESLCARTSLAARLGCGAHDGSRCQMMGHLINACEGADTAVGLRIERMNGVDDDHFGM
jgi:hypothetical protein